MTDTRYVYGARCMWHGPISEISKRGNLPCCPHCQNVLYEHRTKADFDDMIRRTEERGYEGYAELMAWVRESGEHFFSYQDARTAYEARRQ